MVEHSLGEVYSFLNAGKTQGSTLLAAFIRHEKARIQEPTLRIIPIIIIIIIIIIITLFHEGKNTFNNLIISFNPFTFTVVSITMKTSFARTVECPLGVIARGINTTIVCSRCTLVNI